MKRSPFKRKLKGEKPADKDGTTRFKTTTAKKTKTYGRLKSTGKKTEEWASIRDELRKDFIAKGILYCEIRYDEGCRKGVDGFAHTLKRRNMGKWGSEQRKTNLESVVAACNYCHDKVEVQGEEKMAEILQGIIDDRMKRLSKWKKIT